VDSEKRDIDHIFNFMKEKSKLSKFSKKQQRFYQHAIYWHTLPFKNGMAIKNFLNVAKSNDVYFLTPSVFKGNETSPEFLFDYCIKKYQYKLKKRNELSKNDIEYYFPPD
jgi:hypothetical protein